MIAQLSFADADGLRTATAADAEHFELAQLWRPTQQPRLLTGDYETAAVLLRGTFDLRAGKPDGEMNVWPARGARSSPFAGRPMAVFLPPGSVFEADGDGEILLIGARQPVAAPAAEARAALSQSPLLPLAGSGKSFDPTTGEWLPAEAFPTSAESLPPRRMQRLTVDDLTIERVFPRAYKAATLTVDEVVLQAGARLEVGRIPDRPPHRELLLFVRPAGTGPCEVQIRGAATAIDGDAAFLVRTPGGDTDLAITASGGDVYVVLAYAGK